jgi:hypothetical protein
MKIKTSELIDCALDWAVSVAEQNVGWAPEGQDRDYYSSKWEHGGPIIDREHICVLAPIVRRIGAERHAFEVVYWRALKQSDEDAPCVHGRGHTPLIAAMRCYVAVALGDEVDVPEELLADAQPIGRDADGNVICWDAEKKQTYNSGDPE